MEDASALTPWQRAQGWAQEVLVALATTDANWGQAGGRFNYSKANYPEWVTFWPTVHHDSRDQEARVIAYTNENTIALMKLESLSCRFQDDLTGKRGLWSLFMEEIKYQDLSIFDGKRPSFNYVWRNIDGKGTLYSFVVVVSEPHTASWAVVEYYLDEHGDNLLRTGAFKQDASGRLPQTLEKGQAELLGHSIPWEIDFQEMAEKILRYSKLEPFAKALTGAG